MNILNNDQYISIPRKQYEDMEKIVNEKKDIVVNFQLSIMDRKYYNNIDRVITVWESIFELNDKIQIDKLKGITTMIDSACNEIEKMKNEEINSLSKQLAKIESKWWYKLFGG